MAISLPEDARPRAIESIKQYFVENMDEELGDLRAGLLLDFFLQELAPSVYNQAIADAQAYMQDRVADLDGTCHQPEFSYWK